jgi:hypothetical protein
VEYLDGTPDPEAALLYVLFYNSKLKGSGAGVDNPAFSHDPHPIVWIDRGYRMLGNPYPTTFSRAVLLHETGHALGLCARTNHHGKEGHCSTADCLMHRSIRFDITRFLTLRNPWANIALCADCQNELAANRVQPASQRYEFWHGYFRRREDGYQVMGVPGVTYVNFGPALAAPTDDMLEMRRRAIVDMARGEYLHWATIGNFDPWEHLPALRRFAREGNAPLPRLMESLFEDLFGKLEELAEKRPEEALEWLTDEFIEVTKEFPEQGTKFASLREDLSAPPGYGAQLTRQPRKVEPATGNGAEARDRTQGDQEG